jgi:hypothetical protein
MFRELALDLAHSFTADAELFAHVLKGSLRRLVKPVPGLDDTPNPSGQRIERPVVVPLSQTAPASVRIGRFPHLSDYVRHYK